MHIYHDGKRIIELWITIFDIGDLENHHNDFDFKSFGKQCSGF